MSGGGKKEDNRGLRRERIALPLLASPRYGTTWKRISERCFPPYTTSTAQDCNGIEALPVPGPWNGCPKMSLRCGSHKVTRRGVRFLWDTCYGTGKHQQVQAAWASGFFRRKQVETIMVPGVDSALLMGKQQKCPEPVRNSKHRGTPCGTGRDLVPFFHLLD